MGWGGALAVGVCGHISMAVRPCHCRVVTLGAAGVGGCRTAGTGPPWCSPRRRVRVRHGSARAVSIARWRADGGMWDFGGGRYAARKKVVSWGHGVLRLFLLPWVGIRVKRRVHREGVTTALWAARGDGHGGCVTLFWRKHVPDVSAALFEGFIGRDLVLSSQW